MANGKIILHSSRIKPLTMANCPNIFPFHFRINLKHNAITTKRVFHFQKEKIVTYFFSLYHFRFKTYSYYLHAIYILKETKKCQANLCIEAKLNMNKFFFYSVERQRWINLHIIQAMENSFRQVKLTVIFILI